MSMRIVSLSKDELLRLLKVAKNHSENDWLLIATTFVHGLRASEAIAIIGKDVQDGYLTVERLKGSEKTVQPLISHNESLLNYKDALIKRSKDFQDRPLFDISRYDFYHLMRKYGAEAGIARHKCKPHALKHSCATFAINNGVTIDKVKAHLGHKSLSSTGAYLRVSDDTAMKAFADAMGGSI
jgi:integrase/recombinase XerD